MSKEVFFQGSQSASAQQGLRASEFSALARNPTSLLLKCCSGVSGLLGPQTQKPWSGGTEDIRVIRSGGSAVWTLAVGTPGEAAYQHFHGALCPAGIGQGLDRAKAHCPGPWRKAVRLAYQGLVVDLLADELVLTQGVAGLARDGVDGPLLHLLLDGTEQREEGLPGALLGTRGTMLGRRWATEQQGPASNGPYCPKGLLSAPLLQSSPGPTCFTPGRSAPSFRCTCPRDLLTAVSCPICPVLHSSLTCLSSPLSAFSPPHSTHFLCSPISSPRSVPGGVNALAKKSIVGCQALPNPRYIIHYSAATGAFCTGLRPFWAAVSLRLAVAGGGGGGKTGK